MTALHSPGKHWATPTRVRLQCLAEDETLFFAGQDKIKPPSQRQLFRQIGIPRTTAQRILKSNQQRLLHGKSETRGRKNKLTEADIQAVEDLLWQEGFEARSLTWKELCLELNLDCHFSTL